MEEAKRSTSHLSNLYLNIGAEFIRQKWELPSNSDLVQFKVYNKGVDVLTTKEEQIDLIKYFANHLFLRNIALETSDQVVEVTAENRAKIFRALAEGKPIPI